jgi:hypothetical protein
MRFLNWFRKPDTIVEIYKKQKYWRAIDSRNREVLCHSETLASTSNALRAGETVFKRFKNARLDIFP